MRLHHAVVVSLLAARVLTQAPGWPYSMEFGPCMTTTFHGGGLCGTTEKGLVVRLGDRAAVAFDTELLRMAGAWTGGWLRLRGTAYDGAHGPMPERRGQLLAATRSGPAWAKGRGLVDPRPIPHGPLPREWGQYLGYELHGDQVVIGSRVGDMTIREAYSLEAGTVPVLRRTLSLSPSAVEQTMVVCDGPEGAGSASVSIGDAQRFAVLQWVPKTVEPVEIETTTAAWQTLSLGGPAADDYLDPRSGTGAEIRFVPAFARAHGAPSGDSADALRLPVLADGVGAANDDDWQNSVWFDRHEVDGRDTDQGRLLVDLQRVVDVSRVGTYTWHKGERCVQRYALYGAADAAADAAAEDPEAAGWTRLADVDTRALNHGDHHAVGIARRGGLGRFRYLLLDVQSGGAFFSEVDVFAGEHRSKLDTAERERQNLVAFLFGSAGAELVVDGSRMLLRVPPHAEPLQLQLAIAAPAQHQFDDALPALTRAPGDLSLPAGPATARWGEAIVVHGDRGPDDGPFAVDTIAIPFDNRFGSRMRTAAFDFFADGRAAVSTWNGDVWVVSGIDDRLEHVEWRRYATGLFDPLGLRIVGDVVHVLGRDGITRLADDDGNGEADRYECFNNQVYITPAFHEFAFDLQTDAAGNFYFAKGAPVNPGGRGFMPIAPHHGTILKVAKDGSGIAPIATGLRAPNGIGVSPDGILTSGDNEGTYMPRCRLNWIERPGFYGGVKDTAHRTPVPDQPDLPLCWMPMEVDNSSGGQVWVTGAGWPDLAGRLLHLSYGTCSVYLVLPERVNGQMQGGVVRLPANFSSSCMRGRFSPVDGQLYVVGLQGWQTSAAREGGFHRVRRTAVPLDVPVGLRTCTAGVYLTFATPLDEETARDPDGYSVQIWNYRYSSDYGSPEVSVLHPERQAERGKENRDALGVTEARLSPDRRTVFLAVDGMRPVQQMKITWNVDGANGHAVRGELHNSIHALVPDPGFPTER